MTRDLDAIYTKEWYEHDFAELQPEFDLVAAGLERWVRGHGGTDASNLRFALDVGCGPGMLVHALNTLEWYATGFDGSRHAIDYAERLGIRGELHCADVLAPEAGRVERLPIVICTEVAEHIPAEHAPKLVRFLVEHAYRYIVFTAAPPGQGGHDHVNEQPAEYWLDLFAEHGWILDHDSTDEVESRWSKLRRLSHMAKNILVFR